MDLRVREEVWHGEEGGKTAEDKKITYDRFNMIDILGCVVCLRPFSMPPFASFFRSCPSPIFDRDPLPSPHSTATQRSQ